MRSSRLPAPGRRASRRPSRWRVPGGAWSCMRRNARSAIASRDDLQGLENWTTERDVLDELRETNLTTAFAYRAWREGTAFDAWGQAYPVRSHTPLFYMVERGPGDGTLDSALLEQALALGVEVRFSSRLERLEGCGMLAVGPKAADAIAVGYHFETDMDDGFWAICDEALAPKGYAYLLVMNGRGTVKSCMYSGFKQENAYVARTVETFRRLVGLEMRNARPHGGVGNFHIPMSALSGRHPVAGEQAGFPGHALGFRHAARDPLWRTRGTQPAERRRLRSKLAAGTKALVGCLAGQPRALRDARQHRLSLGAAPAGGARCACIPEPAIPALVREAPAHALGPVALSQPAP